MSLRYITPLKNGVVAPYDPATDPNFAAVWESTSGVTSTLGVVSSWTDRVAGIVATGAVGHQPSIVANQINTTLPVLRFTNAVSYQQLVPPATALIPNTAWSLFVVVRPTSAGLSSYGGLAGLTFPTVGNTSGVLVFSSSPAGSGSYGPGPFFGGNPQSSPNTDWPSTFGGYTPTAFTYNTTTFDTWGFTYLGGGLYTMSNFVFAQNFTPLTLKLCLNGLFDPSANALGDYDVAGANSFNGDVAGVYIAKTAITSSELSRFHTYITNTWGI